MMIMYSRELRLMGAGPEVQQEREQTCPYSSLTLVLPAREVRSRVERGQFTPVLNMEETGPSKPDEMV